LPRFAGVRNAAAAMGIAISVSAVIIVGLAGFFRFITP
jgi:hypothetical protein